MQPGDVEATYADVAAWSTRLISDPRPRSKMVLRGLLNGIVGFITFKVDRLRVGDVFCS